MMPKRDATTGQNVVVWGITTLPNASSTYTINFGDGNVTAPAAVGDGSYIALQHTYANEAVYTVTLTVVNGGTTETATTTVNAYDPSGLTPDELRSLNINKTIQDGLRWLWYVQINRTTFATNPTTYWYTYYGYYRSWTALVVLAFQNQGYALPNNNSMPTGIYEKYVVRRGMNFVVDQLQQQQLNVQVAGDPCVGIAASDPGHTGANPTCIGLKEASESEGYATSIAIMALAGSGALNRQILDVTGSQNSNFVGNKTLGEVLQRLVNTLAWGQNDSGCGGNGAGRGGWYYSFNYCVSDGSTIGWNMVALLDAGAAGATIPAFVKPEFKNNSFAQALNADGGFDYNADGNVNSGYYTNAMRAGVALQSMFYTGDNTLKNTSASFINDRWSGNQLGGDYTDTCGSGRQNKGCAYAMFNIFKGLKLQGITTLSNVGRPAGPGAQPANDWYADYQDWLVANMQNPTDPTGGHYGYYGYEGPMTWSCCAYDGTANVAIAELILSPVALVLPDATLFSTVGLSPVSATNPVGTTHTVTANAQSSNNTPVPGATVSFTVLTGPNAGKTGTGTTDSGGLATFTYSDTGGAGTDTIQAAIGNLKSNIVSKTWGDCSGVIGTLTGSMYPLDNGFRTVTLSTTNGVPISQFAVTRVCQDENPNFENVAAYALDGQIVNSNTVKVRAQRSGTRTAPGDGRVYTIKFSSTALQCAGSVTVNVNTTSAATPAAVNNGALWNSVTGANTCP